MQPLILGSHMSIEGGFYRAVERAAEVGCNCVQLFTAPPRQYGSQPLGSSEKQNRETRVQARRQLAEQGQRFQEALKTQNITHPLSHASYLINLASPDQTVRAKGIQAMVDELDRAAALGIPAVVVHPGAFTDSTLEQGLDQICHSLAEIFERSQHTPTRILLENTAGQGTTIGTSIVELGQIIAGATEPERLGVCLDTCHAFAAGYDLRTEEGWEQLMAEVDQQVGLSRVLAFHLNDSKKDCGSRVDRHEHIGLGLIGLGGFSRILNDPRIRGIPMYLETEKGSHEGQDWDTINLRTLRSLLKHN